MPFDVTIEDRKTCNVFIGLDRPFVKWVLSNQSIFPKKYQAQIDYLREIEKDYINPIDMEYVNRARDEIMDYGEVEIDDNAMVSKGAENGAYVMAWVFVYNEEDEEGEE